MTQDGPSEPMSSPRSPGVLGKQDLHEILLGSPTSPPQLGRTISSGGGFRGRRLSQRVDEVEELCERSESLRKCFAQSHPLPDEPQPAAAAVAAKAAAPAAVTAAGGEVQGTLGRFLAGRVADLGVQHWFGVPGDFNLVLLDQLLLEPRLKMVCTCNELNGGYAADGYARATGLACLVTTFSVGGLSAINAVAGAYAEGYPIICIVGAPPTTAWGAPRILHHSLGKAGDLDFELQCYKQVTCYQTQIRNLDMAFHEISAALTAAVTQRKPVYISVPANLAAAPHPSFAKELIPFSVAPPTSNSASLEAAVDCAAAQLAKAVKPVLICGAQMRSPRAQAAMQALAEASGMPVAVMPNAKGLFPETHPNYIGVFWENISTPCCGEVVVSADAYLIAGPVFTDASTCGFTHMLVPACTIEAGPTATLVGAARFFGNVLLEDFLEQLAKKAPQKGAALKAFRKLYVPPGVPLPMPDSEPLLVKSVYKHIETLLTGHHAVLVDAGDSWFHAHKLRLPEGCGYEIQLLYASIGWSVGATLGYGLGAPSKRAVCIVGDGAFRMTAQEVSTILTSGTHPIIFIMNNQAYTIEIEIHDGPYNALSNWNYSKLVEAMDGDSKGLVHTVQVRTDSECERAVKEAAAMTDKTVVIECILDPDDCSVDVLQFGKVLQFANSKNA